VGRVHCPLYWFWHVHLLERVPAALDGRHPRVLDAEISRVLRRGAGDFSQLEADCSPVTGIGRQAQQDPEFRVGYRLGARSPMIAGGPVPSELGAALMRNPRRPRTVTGVPPDSRHCRSHDGSVSSVISRGSGAAGDTTTLSS
jgi:hypothetical protein